MKIFISSVLFLFSSLGRCLGLSEMTLEQKVGQIFIIGVSGKQMSPGLKTHLNDLQPGGVLLFKRNIESRRGVAAFTQELQADSKTPLFLAVDQEGGLVNRLSTSPALPSARWVGRANNPELTEQLGFAMGQILREAGVNMNLAPVLDVDEDSSDRFLKSRTYASTADKVGKLGVAFAEGLLRAGVIPTAKHFPGLGSVSGDPHKQAVSQSAPVSTIWNKHLLPFRRFSKLSPSAIMLSHATYPALGAQEPAPFSKTVSEIILKKKLSYDGLIITDDLMMVGAGDKSLTFQDRVVKVFRGGSDMLLIAWSNSNQKSAHRALLRAVKNKQISMADLDRRVEKILRTKSWLAKKERARSIASDPDSDLKNVIQKLNLVNR